MKKADQSLDVARRILSCTLILTIVAAAVYGIWGQTMLRALFEGRSVAYLNDIVAWLRVKDARYADPSFFFDQINGLVTRSGALVLGVQIVFAVWIWRYPDVLTSFIEEKSHPINLALFRVVFFAVVLLNINEERILWYSTLPADLQVAPPGWEELLGFLPLNAGSAAAGIFLLRLSASLALLGLFTRTSAWATVLIGIYVLGIPQMYGKLNHYHHLIWFAALLGSGRSGDVLSMDALWRAWKQSREGMPSRPVASSRYALPLKMTWLLMGLIYFFPGFWKFALSGLEWAFSDNLKFKMYASWANYGTDLPFFRADQHPAFYQAGGLFTIFFELAFIFLIFTPVSRIFAAGCGLFFHNMTRLFMFISFTSLQACYVSMFDWHRIVGKLGRLLFPEPCRLIFDRSNASHRCIAGCLHALDILGRISCHGQTGTDRLMIVTDDEGVYAGAEAWYSVIVRMPVLWVIVPFLWVARHIQHSSNAADGVLRIDASRFPTNEPRSARAVLVVGCTLLAINGLCGITLVDSWPVGTYPTFATLAGPTVSSVVVSVDGVTTTDSEINLFASDTARDAFAGERLRILVERILATRDENTKRARALALWDTLVQLDPSMRAAEGVTFYKVQVGIEPENLGKEISREEIFSFSTFDF